MVHDSNQFCFIGVVIDRMKRRRRMRGMRGSSGMEVGVGVVWAGSRVRMSVVAVVLMRSIS